MAWYILGALLVVAVAALVANSRRPEWFDTRSAHHAVALLAVGVAMIAIGVIVAIVDGSGTSYTLPIIGIVFTAVGAQRLRDRAG